MHEHERTDDEDISLIRAADPAGTAVAPPSLRERVDVIAGESVAEPIPLRRRRWLMPVAAAAAVAVGVGGGYLVGAGALTPTSEAAATLPLEVGSAGDPAPPISLGGSDDGARAQAATADAGGAAGAEFAANSIADTVSPWHYSNNRRFTAPAFDAGPDESLVYALDGRAHYSAAEATRMAGALGMAGEAHQDVEKYGPGWVVGDPQSRGPQFWMWPTGGGEVSYSSGIDEPWGECYALFAPQYDLQNGAEEVYRAFDAEVNACVAATPMPTEQQAREAMSTFLGVTGVDEATTEITVTPSEESRTIWVSAARVVDANTTVVTSSVTVSHKGMLNASGPSATIASLGEYAIITPDEAAARLNDPVYAPQWASETTREIEYDDEAATEPPALPQAGADVPWGITEFEISSARLGLALMTSTDDERFLAPAYEFTDTEGNVWSVIALAESELDTTGGGIGYGGGWWGPMY